MELETFGLWSSFEVEVDPESPVRGWRCPTYTFDRDGVAVPGLDSIGPSLLIRVSTSSQEWVGRFMAGTAGGETCVVATPTPDVCCVISDGRAYLVDTEASPPKAEVILEFVRTVEASSEAQLLVLADWNNAAAVGAGGVRSRTERLAIDDLVVSSVTTSGVFCECDSPGVGGVRRIVLDPRNGQQISGPRLPDQFR